MNLKIAAGKPLKSRPIIVVLLAVLVNCGHNPVPDVRVYKEIPFIDAPEGIYLNTVSEKEGVIRAGEWEQLKPQLLCLDGDGWLAVKLKWLESCRYLGQDCTADIQSVDKTVQKLNSLAEEVLKGFQ